RLHGSRGGRRPGRSLPSSATPHVCPLGSASASPTRPKWKNSGCPRMIRFVATDVFDYHRPSKCRLRVHLRAHGIPEASPGPFEETLRRLGKEHEARHHRALAASTGVADLSVIPERRERERE